MGDRRYGAVDQTEEKCGVIKTGLIKTGAVDRKARRLKTFQTASLHVAGGVRRVHLLNLSTSGALVHSDNPPAAGTACRLDATIDLGAARVMWVAGQRFGVMFDRPISDRSLSLMVEGHGPDNARVMAR
ncbi:PilZ domain-containing protein [Sphingomonas sp. So64.6b]|uniref:PilZ domain-containing protein n=1 Tax=Sphingomonas sp. So64.6b TaxID=2997354 RepID=UPI0016002571|nr:PilZ domain-containing protein [Sphingomonas sp. So64.6b]QNA85238.1 PilZ domain-containing protein [Sphingomonas sp. So64.6b]